MKIERQPSNPTIIKGPMVPPFRPGADQARDEDLQEPSGSRPNMVDLAKHPGLLYRLHAMLHA